MVLFDQAGAGERASTLMASDPPLSSFVEHFWAQYVPETVRAQKSWRIVPDASAHIIVVVLPGTRFLENMRCAVVGARSRFADISVAGRRLTFGARLRPGVLPLLTRLPASDFTDRSVLLQQAFGLPGEWFVEQLADQRTAEAALRLLSGFLLTRLGNRNPPRETNALQTQSNRAQDLADLMALPNRTLHARMKERVGLAPKRFLRVQRLHRTLGIWRKCPRSWAQVSVMGGFADQPHLVREFRDLLGEAPNVWKQRTEVC